MEKLKDLIAWTVVTVFGLAALVGIIALFVYEWDIVLKVGLVIGLLVLTFSVVNGVGWAFNRVFNPKPLIDSTYDNVPWDDGYTGDASPDSGGYMRKESTDV